MLSEIKESYRQHADLIPDWRKLNRSQLCFKYIEYEKINPKLAEAYLSAIMFKCLNIVQHNSRVRWFYHADEHACYDWLTSSIIYVLNKRVWTDPKHPLYNDVNAPEKCINVAIYSQKINYTKHAKRQKREIMNNTLSLEALCEGNNDVPLAPYFDEDTTLEALINSKVRKFFSLKDYFKAFLIDAIITVNFNLNENLPKDLINLSIEKKLKHHLFTMSDEYLHIFSKQYGIDYEKVKLGFSYISSLSRNKLAKHLKQSLAELSRDSDILLYFGR